MSHGERFPGIAPPGQALFMTYSYPFSPVHVASHAFRRESPTKAQGQHCRSPMSAEAIHAVPAAIRPLPVSAARFGTVRHDWTVEEVRALFTLPFLDLLLQAQQVHRLHFAPNQVQVSTLLSIKTGACPEDCSYCPQSIRYETGLAREELMQVEDVKRRAAAWKTKKKKRAARRAAPASPARPRFLLRPRRSKANAAAAS